MDPTGSPEELETLLEDAFVVKDHAALAGLFRTGAVLLTDAGRREARGSADIAGVLARMWHGGRLYLAGRGPVIQACDTALVLGRDAVNVARRGEDGSWRYAISVLEIDPLVIRQLMRSWPTEAGSSRSHA